MHGSADATAPDLASGHPIHPEGSDFSGPLFIVGMPRSGTKLLRDLLNQHPDVAIPTVESHFIPVLSKRAELVRRCRNDNEAYARLYSVLSRTHFALLQAELGEWPDAQSLRAQIRKETWPGVLEAIFMSYARRHDARIWGDKTPQYLIHVILLARLFPSARFIHIVRDVRDYALSSHKVWGKHLYRSALRWEEDIAAAKEQAAALHPGAWLEVHYEDLLRDPDTTMANVCGFLQIEYSSSVARLQKPAENLGDTSGRTELDTGNIAKWQRELTERQVLRIEEIAFNTMKRTGYETNFATSYRSVDGVRQLAYKLHDWSAIFLFKLRSESGLRRALQNIVSSWRFREHQ